MGDQNEQLNFGNLTQKAEASHGQNFDSNMPQGQAFAGTGSFRNSMMPNGMSMKELNQDQPGKKAKGDYNLFNALIALEQGRTLGGTKDEALDLSVHFGKGGKDDGNANDAFGLGMDEEEEIDEQLKGDTGGGQTNDLENGVVIAEKTDDIIVTTKMKQREQDDRDQKIENYDGELRAFQKKLKKESHHDEAMTEENFWGQFGGDENEETLDFGRDYCKEGQYEKMMTLPFDQIPLFQNADWHESPSTKPIVQVGGILRSGKLHQASLKALIKMVEADDDKNSDENSKEEEEDNQEEKKKGKDQSDNKGEIVLEKVKEIEQNFKYNLLRNRHLDELSKKIQETYRVRIYLITAQNLTATGTVIDMKSRLAGMTALSTANPYPVLQIGDNKAEQNRYINDRENSVDGELNPKFFRMYELDCVFPKEWKLEISIMDKSFMAQLDSLIGSTTIDIENRFFGNRFYMARIALSIDSKFWDDKFDEHKKGKTPKEKIWKPKAKKWKDKAKAAAKKLKEIEQIIIPIENRELNHPQKLQAQGVIETWIEIFPLDEARKISVQKIQAIEKKKFEIRLIIWETRQVPLVDGDSVDIWVRVIYDPTGWVADQVEKKTDIHQNSKTGWGLFNWRFKFDLEIPCDFPRIKFIIHDAGVFTDEAIGEATLNLKRTCNKLLKEDFVEVPKTYITCRHANMPEEDRGVIMFSMTILTKDDADAEPVGESWDEPNVNPTLKKPTVGRGLAAMLGGLGGNWNFDFDWNPFGKFLPWIMALTCILGLMVGAMYLKMLGIW